MLLTLTSYTSRLIPANQHAGQLIEWAGETSLPVGLIMGLHLSIFQGSSWVIVSHNKDSYVIKRLKEQCQKILETLDMNV